MPFGRFKLLILHALMISTFGCTLLSLFLFGKINMQNNDSDTNLFSV